jgi:ADP-ribosylation factor protein 1
MFGHFDIFFTTFTMTLLDRSFKDPDVTGQNFYFYKKGTQTTDVLMGNTALATLFDDNFEVKKAKVLFLGFNGAGKTTILYTLLENTPVKMCGLHVETLVHKQVEMTVWDIGGEMIKHWSHYLTNTTAIVFVVSSEDTQSLDDTRKELHNIITSQQLSKCLILVYANKYDLPNAMPIQDIIEGLNLYDIKQNWHIQACSAKQSEGLTDGIDWLSTNLRQNS